MDPGQVDEWGQVRAGDGLAGVAGLGAVVREGSLGGGAVNFGDGDPVFRINEIGDRRTRIRDSFHSARRVDYWACVLNVVFWLVVLLHRDHKRHRANAVGAAEGKNNVVSRAARRGVGFLVGAVRSSRVAQWCGRGRCWGRCWRRSRRAALQVPSEGEGRLRIRSPERHRVVSPSAEDMRYSPDGGQQQEVDTMPTERRASTADTLRNIVGGPATTDPQSPSSATDVSSASSSRYGEATIRPTRDDALPPDEVDPRAAAMQAARLQGQARAQIDADREAARRLAETSNDPDLRPPVLELKDLTKFYQGGIKANDCVNFHVHRGEIFGLLGHNGAGKINAKMLECPKPQKTTRKQTKFF